MNPKSRLILNLTFDTMNLLSFLREQNLVDEFYSVIIEDSKKSIQHRKYLHADKIEKILYAKQNRSTRTK